MTYEFADYMATQKYLYDARDAVKLEVDGKQIRTHVYDDCIIIAEHTDFLKVARAGHAFIKCEFINDTKVRCIFNYLGMKIVNYAKPERFFVNASNIGVHNNGEEYLFYER